MPKGSRVQDTINRLNVGSPAPHKRISLTPRGTESKLRAPRVSRAISRDDSALDALQPPPIRARNNSDPLSPRIRAPPKVPPRPPQPLVSKIPKQFLQKFDSPLRNASSSLEKSNKAASKHASDLPQAQRRQHGRAANDSKKKKVGNLRSKTPPARAGERKGNKRNPPDLSRSGSQRLLMFRGEGEKSSSIASDENINDDYRTSDDGLPTPKCRPPPPPNIKQQKKKRPPALPSSTTEEEQQYSSSSSSTSNGGGPRKKPPPIPASILLRKRSKNRLLPAAPANDSRSSSGANDAANIERTRHSSIYQGGNRERDSRLERVKTAPFLLGDSSCPPTPPRTRPARRGRGGQGNPPPLPMRRPTIHSKSQARGPPVRNDNVCEYLTTCACCAERAISIPSLAIYLQLDGPLFFVFVRITSHPHQPPAGCAAVHIHSSSCYLPNRVITSTSSSSYLVLSPPPVSRLDACASCAACVA